MTMAQAEKIPSIKHYKDDSNVYIGGENKDITISRADLDKDLQAKVDGNKRSLLNFYVRVMPLVINAKFGSGSSNPNMTEPFVYSIAFYDKK